MPALAETVRRTIARHRMLTPGQTVLAAVSGGPDSISMLHVLVELGPSLGIKIAVAHLDHGFRPESGEEASFVSDTAAGLGLPCIVEKSDLAERLKGSPANKQAAAREARYEFLQRAAVQVAADRIAVGHTADDQAETCLMRVVRGSGALGMSAIPPVRGNIVRPLLDATRDEVIKYLGGRGLPYKTDPSNLRPDYLRNSVRLRLMPLLKEYNPGVVLALCHGADILREEEEFLTAFTEDLLAGMLSEGPHGALSIELAAFGRLPAAIKRRALRVAIKKVKGDLMALGYGHVDEAAGNIATGETGRGIDIPGGVRVEKSYGHLLVYRPDTMSGDYSVPLAIPGTVKVDGAGITVEARMLPPGAAHTPDGPHEAVFDMDRLTRPLEVRNRRRGDSFHPVGMEGTKKLKEYFIDLKLPRLERRLAPILTCGAEIAWVMGKRLDRRFAADAATKKVILIKYKPYFSFR